ncbi:hypothetical protein IAU59_004090 [Kwoniella sp. CBS 9459]
MPRKLPISIPAAVAPVEQLIAPPPPSPIVQTLRKDWRWAAISQFIWTFSDAFGLVDWDIERLESDFDGDEQAYIPTLIAKLLFALTYNRQINRDNAFDNLRKQYAKRKPEVKCVLGTEEHPIAWATLGLSQKVKILHELCEWQLEDPARFRGLLKSEEEAASWRVEPVGWDKAGNTYWLFDDNRLWIQREPPPPPRPAKKTSQKAKKAGKKPRPSVPSSAPKKLHKKKERTPLPTPSPPPPDQTALSGSRRRNPISFYGNPTPTAQALKKGSLATPSSNVASGSRPTRSSARNGGVSDQAPMESPTKTTSTPIPLGTRVSRRLRNVDDEWQQVPDDWLSTPIKAENRRSRKGKGKARAADEESDLSELTDEEEHERILLASGAKIGGSSRNEVEHAEMDIDGHPAPSAAKEKEEEEEKMDIDEKSSEVVVQPSLTQEDHEEPESRKIERANEEDGEKHQAPDETAGVNGSTSPVKAKSPTPQLKGHGDGSQLAVQLDQSQSGSADELSHNAAVSTDVKEPAEQAKPVEDGDDLPKEEANGEVVHVEGDQNGVAELEEAKPTLEEKVEDERPSYWPDDFVEWEAVCVTLYDWRTFPEQFAKSKDEDEQNLYALLTEEVGPTIIEVLVAKEQERIKQEAVNNRKRSSRIATRELEREEAIRREAAEREMEERMEKIRAEELRKAAEEAEHLAREKAREERLREREERAAAREEALLRKAEEEAREREKKERRREKRKRRREGEEVSDDSEDEMVNAPVANGSKRATPANGIATPQERWELACEVCKKTGWNLDDDQDVVCCDDCGRWQHVECHDALDIREGRGRRNWDAVDFKCKECIERAARKRQRLEHPHANGHHQHPLAQVQQAPFHQPVPPPSYPIVPGSAPGPQPPLNPAKPPPPPLAPGEFYLPYPHPPAREDRPAGFAVYYPPGQQSPAQQLLQQQQHISPERMGCQASPSHAQVHQQPHHSPQSSSSYSAHTQPSPYSTQAQSPMRTYAQAQEHHPSIAQTQTHGHNQLRQHPRADVPSHLQRPQQVYQDLPSRSQAQAPPQIQVSPPTQRQKHGQSVSAAHAPSKPQQVHSQGLPDLATQPIHVPPSAADRPPAAAAHDHDEQRPVSPSSRPGHLAQPPTSYSNGHRVSPHVSTETTSGDLQPAQTSKAIPPPPTFDGTSHPQ